jgi:hypothetical protein
MPFFRVQSRRHGIRWHNPVQIVPDARTNRIFAMGRPVDLRRRTYPRVRHRSDQRNFLRRSSNSLQLRIFFPSPGMHSPARSREPAAADEHKGGAGRWQSSTAEPPANEQRSSTVGGSQGNASGGTGGSQPPAAAPSPQVNSAPESLLIGAPAVADSITNSGDRARLQII